MPTVKNEGAELYYEVCGKGPAIVFAHGAGGNTLVWWQQVPFFAERWRVLVFDHRGFGRSSCALDLLHPRFFVSDLLSILNAAELDRAAIVCQSMGGLTGLPFALAHPERTSALVLCGTSGGIAARRFLNDWSEALPRMGTTPIQEMAFSRSFPSRDPFRSFLYSQLGGLSSPDSMPSIFPRFPTVLRQENELADFRVPTLVLAGSEDWFFRAETLADVASRIPGARFQLLEGIGHSAYFEAPERFNPAVEEFLVSAGANVVAQCR